MANTPIAPEKLARARQLHQAGAGRSTVLQATGISKKTYYKYIQPHAKAPRSMAPAHQSGGRTILVKGPEEALGQLQTYLTERQVTVRFYAETGKCYFDLTPRAVDTVRRKAQELGVTSFEQRPDPQVELAHIPILTGTAHTNEQQGGSRTC